MRFIVRDILYWLAVVKIAWVFFFIFFICIILRAFYQLTRYSLLKAWFWYNAFYQNNTTASWLSYYYHYNVLSVSQNAFPVSGLFTTHLLSLDALLTVVDSIEQHCHRRILSATKSAPAAEGDSLQVEGAFICEGSDGFIGCCWFSEIRDWLVCDL